jgi:HEAT repeat protein
MDTRDVGLIPEPDLEERGRRAGTRYQVLRQPGSEKYLKELRTLVDAVNRDSKPDLVRRSIEHPDPAMRYWSLVGLGKTAASAAAARELILKATGDPEPAVRIAALRAAALHLADDTAIPKLAAEMKHANTYVRLHAAQALDALGSRAAPARKALTDALSDESEYVKRIAQHAVSSLSGA